MDRIEKNKDILSLILFNYYYLFYNWYLLSYKYIFYEYIYDNIKLLTADIWRIF